eukprot:75352_1
MDQANICLKCVDNTRMMSSFCKKDVISTSNVRVICDNKSISLRIFLILFDQNTPLKIRKNALCILHMKFKCLPISFAYNFDMKSTQFHYDCIVPNVNREFVKIGMDVCAIVLHLSPWTRVLKLSASCH